jgi:hypothetical protein
MNTDTTTVARRWTSRLRILAAIVLILMGGNVSRVCAQDVAPRFPDPAKVTTDYPDDAQRFAAFTVLSEAMAQAAPKPISKTDYARIFAYQAGATTVASQEMMKVGSGTPAYRDFNARGTQYSNDANFVSALLDKYHLNGIPTYTGPATSVADEMKYDVPTHLPQALPWILVAGILPMALAAWLILRGSGIGRKVFPVPPPVPGGLPALPKSLQVVSLPGVRYAAYVLSGRVLDVQVSSHSSSHTHTSGGDTYQTSSGQTHTTPLQTWTSVTNIRETVIWVRSPDGRETPWTLFNSNFQCRLGQTISILVRPLRDGTGHILLAYNHSAGALEQCPALAQSHETRGNELGQWSANLVGAYVAWKVLALFLPPYAGNQLDTGFVVAWLVACFMLVVASFFIITPLVKSFIRKRRNARFNTRYLPGYRQFFQQGRPVIP